MVPTIPSRTNPSRKAKEASTPATPTPMVIENAAPKAKRKVEFSPMTKESKSQDVSQPNELSTPCSQTDEESGGDEQGSEAESQGSEQPDEEIEMEKPAEGTAEGRMERRWPTGGGHHTAKEIREEGGKYLFYEPGESRREMKKPSGVEARSARKLEMRLAKLEEMETKLHDIEDAIYKTRRSQLQLLNILN